MSYTPEEYNTFLKKGIEDRNNELEATRAELWFNKLPKETQENIMNMNRNDNTGGRKYRRKSVKIQKRCRVKKHKTTLRRRKRRT